MKNRISLFYVALLATFALCLTAQAQVDFFGQPRTVQLAKPQVLNGAVVSGPVTNQPIDIHHFMGVVKVDIFSCTNTAGVVTATLETSDDTTTWRAIANYALATATTLLYTNANYPTNQVVGTNTILLPGTATTPTAGTAGWATPYVVPAPFTNSAALTLATGIYSVGIDTEGVGRYLHVVWTPSGSTTNTSVGAVLTGRSNNYP